MSSNDRHAPGWPGLPPRWTSSAKTGVGTARSTTSLVWFTLSHGVFDEIYFPQVDLACVRDMGHLVSDGRRFFSEEKRDTVSQVSYLEPGVPAYKLVNTCKQGRYRIEKEIIADPQRDVVLQTHPLRAADRRAGRLSPLRPAVAAPRQPRQWQHRLARRLQERAGAVRPARQLCPGAGVVGQLAEALRGLRRQLRRLAGHLAAQAIDRALRPGRERQCRPDRRDRLCKPATASSCWRSASAITTPPPATAPSPACQNGFEVALEHYLRRLAQLAAGPAASSTASRKAAAISIAPAPWCCGCTRPSTSKAAPSPACRSPGASRKADDDLGGYHLVWPRDMVETAGALLAAGAVEDARRVLGYLQATQEAGRPLAPEHVARRHRLLGRHPDGRDRLPDLARRHGPPARRPARRRPGALLADGRSAPPASWSATARSRRRIAGRRTPATRPFTLAVEIAGLLAAADLADLTAHPQIAQFLRETADTWNDQHRSLDLRDRHRAGQEGRRRRLLRPHRPAGHRRRAVAARRASCRSRIARRDRATSPPPSWSARTRCRWSASACAAPTIRASSTPSRSSTPS